MHAAWVNTERFAKAIVTAGRLGATANVLRASGPAIIVVGLDTAAADRSTLVDAMWAFGLAATDRPIYRGVAIDRLPQILAHGCDVFPTNSLLFASPYPDKCLEYGCVIEIFDAAHLRSTWQEVPVSIAPDELDALMKEYPTKLTSEDGAHFWLSRMPSNDRRISSQYEVEWGRWIPGDAQRALAALLIFSPSPSDHERVTALLSAEDRHQ
jgi:hypothetical protein